MVLFFFAFLAGTIPRKQNKGCEKQICLIVSEGGIHSTLSERDTEIPVESAAKLKRKTKEIYTEFDTEMLLLC